MELRQLEYFLAVVECEGLNRAAQHLHVSQPTLSQSIGALERELKVLLFHRTGRRLVLSPMGALLVPAARDILGGVTAARDAMNKARDLETGSVTIGTMPEMSGDAVASWSGSFRRLHPQVRLDISEFGSARELCDEIIAGRCEVGFTTSPVPVSTLDCVDLGVQRLLLVMPPGTERPAADPLAIKDIESLPLVVSQQAQRENDSVAATLRSEGVQPYVLATMPNRHAQLTLVLGGGVHAFLPLRMAVRARRLGAVVVETDPMISTPFGIVHRSESLSPAASRLVSECARTLRQWFSEIDAHRAAGQSLLDAATSAYQGC
ncbi:LysR family transcriptional regulator [Streptomyces sp. NPDC055078]